jgi:hypothetical protein
LNIVNPNSKDLSHGRLAAASQHCRIFLEAFSTIDRAIADAFSLLLVYFIGAVAAKPLLVDWLMMSSGILLPFIYWG